MRFLAPRLLPRGASSVFLLLFLFVYFLSSVALAEVKSNHVAQAFEMMNMKRVEETKTSPSEEKNADTSSSLSKPEIHIPSMTWEAWLTASVCVALLFILMLDLMSIAGTMVVATVILRLSGLVSSEEALAGLSNSGVVAIQLLLICVSPIAELDLVKKLVRAVMSGSAVRSNTSPASAGGDIFSHQSSFAASFTNPSSAIPTAASASGNERKPPSLWWPTLKLCALAMVLSCFCSTVTVVTILTGLTSACCIECRIPVSQILLPMNVAAILGGSFSVIGASTTMIVQGMAERTPMGPLPFFEFIKVSGVPSVLAIIYLLLAPPIVLRAARPGLLETVQERRDTFLAQFIVLPSSPIIGQSPMNAMRHLPPAAQREVQLLAVARGADSRVTAPLEAYTTIEAGDVLEFAGNVSVLIESAGWLHLEWLPMSDEEPTGEEHPTTTATMPTSADLSNLHHRRSRGLGRNPSFEGVSPISDSVAVRRSSVLLTQLGSAHSTRGAEAEACFAEVVLSDRSPLVGRPSAWRVAQSYYRACVVAVRRGGRRAAFTDLRHSPQSTLRAGDTLLLVVNPRTLRQFSPHFLSVTLIGADPASEDRQMQRQRALILLPSWFPFGRWVINGRLVHQAEPHISQRHSTNTLTTSSSARTTTTTNASATKGSRGPIRSTTAIAMEKKGYGSTTSADVKEHLLASPHAERGIEGKDHPSKKETQRDQMEAAEPLLKGGGSAGEQHVELRHGTVGKAVWLPSWYPYLSLVIFGAALGCSISGFQLELCLECAVVALVAGRFLTLQEAMRCLSVDVFIIMAFSFGIGAAMRNSGLSSIIGLRIVESGLHGWPLLFCVCFISCLMANVISGKASVQVLFPIVYDVFVSRAMNPLPGIVLLACGTCVSLVTPYAHAVNLIVMGPGGYTPRDFLVFGLPLNIFMCAAMATMASAVYGSW